MKPKVNENCIACGTCEAVCPEVFKGEEVGGAMKANPQSANYEALKGQIDEAIAACPVQAIEWEK